MIEFSCIYTDLQDSFLPRTELTVGRAGFLGEEAIVGFVSLHVNIHKVDNEAGVQYFDVSDINLLG